MKNVRKIVSALAISFIMILGVQNKARAQDMRQYYAMASQLIQMAAIMQAQAQQLYFGGMQGNIVNQAVMQQPVANPVDIQAIQAQQAMQALLLQQAQQQALLQQQAIQAQQIQSIQPVPTTVVQQPVVQQSVVQQPVVQQPVSHGVMGNADNFNTYDISSQQQVDTRYVLNLHTHKFHYPACSEVAKIKPENYQPTNASYNEIIANGYSPCGKCNPQ